MVGAYVYMNCSILMFLMSFTFMNPLYRNNAGFYCANADSDFGMSAFVPGLSGCASVAAAIEAGSEDLGLLCSLPREDFGWRHPGASIVSQYGLYCERDWMVALAETGFFVGFLVGNGVLGTVTDR